MYTPRLYLRHETTTLGPCIMLYISMSILVFHSVVGASVAICIIKINVCRWTFIVSDTVMKNKCYGPFQAVSGGCFPTGDELAKRDYRVSHFHKWIQQSSYCFIIVLVASCLICICASFILSLHLVSDTIMLHRYQNGHTIYNPTKS